MIREFVISSSVLMTSILCITAFADRPRIAQIYPDFPDINAPKLIIGENFSEDIEIWQYRPEQDSENINEPLPKTPYKANRF